MRLPNGIETQDRSILGLDWQRSKVDVYDSTTKGFKEFKNIEEAAEAYPGSMFILEATGESYELQRRDQTLKALDEFNVLAYCYKTQKTARFRKALKITKSDKKDARTIYRIGTETKFSLHRFSSLVEADPIRESIKDFLVEDRYLHDGAKSYALAEKYLTGTAIPEDFRVFLFSGKDYRAQIGRILSVALEVRKHGRGRRMFECQLGNYGNGYTSMPRSEFYYWWARGVFRTRYKSLLKKKDADDERSFYDRLTVSQKELYRKNLRVCDKVADYLWALTAPKP